jgi:nicotinamidase-related amidase
MRLAVQFHRIGRIYGPGMPSVEDEGLVERTLELEVRRTALVSVHCWNVGEPDGPYPIEEGTRCPGTPADWVAIAHGIIRDRIRPVVQAARLSEMPVFHLAQSGYARKYPQYAAIAADPDLQEPEGLKVEGCVRRRDPRAKWDDQYGPEFPGPVWVTHPDTFDIAKNVRPIDNEPVFLTGVQLNGLCRRNDIDTLIYVGFMADLCLVNISGAIREMTNRFGYRCIVLRDCTTAYEYADTVNGQWMTRTAIRSIEADGGYSATSDAFIAALA